MAPERPKPGPKDEKKARAGLLGAQKRWGTMPKWVDLEGLTQEQRTVLVELVNEMRDAAQAAQVAALQERNIARMADLTPEQQYVIRSLMSVTKG